MTSVRRLSALVCLLLVVPVLAATVTPTAAAVAGPAQVFEPLDGYRPAAGDDARVRPTEYRAYRADVAAIARQLAGPGVRTIAVPAPTGELATFSVVEDSVMEPALQAAHPELRTYAGTGPGGSTIRLDVTPMGFHAMVRNPDGLAWYVDPARNAVGEEVVLSYLGAALPRAEREFTEGALKRAAERAAGRVDGFAPAPGGQVSSRTYRLAFVTDKSYADAFGSANVFAEKTTLVNRVNEVYNDDLAIKFVMVTGTDTKLNLDTNAKQTGANGPCGASACYTAGQLSGCQGSTLDRNEFVLGQLIGAENFDIGHIGLGKNGGGIAGLGVVGGPFKADGCTGVPTPKGDLYAIDYFAHEVGHQMGADHTFNGTEGACSAGNRNSDPFATQVEPGSGSSIMAYAGICDTDDLQPHSDPYFSLASVDQINATTASAASNENEQQIVNLASFDATDSFTLSCAGCPTSATIANGSSYTNVQLAAAVQAVTGQVGTVTNRSATGFTVDWNASTADIPTLTVTPVSGTFTAFTGTTYNGGPTDAAGAVAATANSSPVVTVPTDKSIPTRTPFTLTGSATDPNGDPVTYLWEQADAGGATGTGLVDNLKVNGPLFRQFGVAANVSAADTQIYDSPGENLANGNPSRTFPDLAQVLAGNTNAKTGSCPAAGSEPVNPLVVDCYSEFLPTTAWLGNPTSPRVLHFRLTARDRFTGATGASTTNGGLSFAEMALTVEPTAGPFLVTSRATSGTASGAETVTWAVAGTNTAALAQNVRISLSTDGGQTFPTVLAASTPNDGSQVVTLPSVATTTARLKVEAVGNYFFAVNDTNFSITPSVTPPPPPPPPPPGVVTTHRGDGKASFTSKEGASKSVADARGKSKLRFTVDQTGTALSGSASFKFKKGKVSFTGNQIAAATTSGRTLTFTVQGTNRGRAGFSLVVVALDGPKDKVRIRLLKGTKVVYDSMPGKPTSKGPKTKVKGSINVG